jgi:hypothetical protein
VSAFEASAASPNAATGYVEVKLRLADFDPDTKSPDYPIYCYSAGTVFQHIVDRVKAELVRRLLRLMTYTEAPREAAATTAPKA